MLVILLLLCCEPETTIVHIRDWHYVHKEAFAIDTGLKERKLDKAYEKHLKTVERVQKGERKLLKNVDTVYLEGLSEEDLPIFNLVVEAMKNSDDIPREAQLRIGAAGQLLLEGKLKVLPAGANDFRKYDPIKDGTFELDEMAMQEREDAILKPGTHYLILGGAHDLADNIKRLAPHAAYKMLTPKAYPKESSGKGMK